MAQLVALGGDHGHKALRDYDTVDLQAVELARQWGVNENGHKPRQWFFTPARARTAAAPS